jgi:signal transduction histidine kinase
MSAQLLHIHDGQRSGSCHAAIDGYEGDEHTMDVEVAGSSTNVRAAMICHEIRNPIGALQNGIALVGSGSLDFEGLTRISEMMQRQLAQIARLLDDLGDGVCLTSRKLRIKNEPVDLAEVSLHALDTIDRFIDDKRQALSIALPPAGAVCVRGDHGRLVEVVVNLLENASKYTETGGRIVLGLEANSGTATLTVRDSGMGIPTNFLPRIFDLFWQRTSLPDVIERGLGLGLPMVRNLVRLHGGEVSVYSAGEGQGSEFTVRLPRLLTT